MNNVERDAHEFGNHVRQGGWRLGLLVARNVEKGVGGRGQVGVSQPRNSNKISAAEFARLSGTTADRVLRHLTAWERAADAGHVQHAAELAPGDELDLVVETLPQWGDFYDASDAGGRPRDSKPGDAITIVERQTPSERGRIVAQLLADPETRAAVVEIPTGIAAVTAMRHLVNLHEDREGMRPAPLPSPPAFASAFWRAVGSVDELAAELERFGVRGIDARPETRAAAERLAALSAGVRDAIVDFVVDNIATEEAS